MEALIVGVNAVLLDFREQILQFAAREKLPAIYALREFVVSGGLLYYGSDDIMMASNTADYVRRIVQGAKPSELPVDRRNVVRLVVNLKTARALGIKIPQSILLRADEVIE